jgi:hypothetical protein
VSLDPFMGSIFLSMKDYQLCSKKKKKKPEFLKHEGHQHFLFLALRHSYETCNGYGEERLMGFVCANCDKFALCIRCATLPFVAKHQYDTHHLKLYYTHEDDFQKILLSNL